MKGDVVVLWFVLIIAILTVCEAFFQSNERCRPSCRFDCPYDRPDPVQRGWFYSIRRDKRDVGDYLYRVIRDDEDPSAGLQAKNPQATRSLTSHVRCGSRNNYRSQYISATKSLEVAYHYGGDNRIVRINTGIAEDAGCEIIDISDGHGLNGDVAKNYARRSQEVLITGCVIPADALIIVRA